MLEIITIIARLTALAQKAHDEGREATIAEVDAAIASARASIGTLDQSIADREAREAAGD